MSNHYIDHDKEVAKDITIAIINKIHQDVIIKTDQVTDLGKTAADVFTTVHHAVKESSKVQSK